MLSYLRRNGWLIALLGLYFIAPSVFSEGSNGSTTVELACGESTTVDSNGANPPPAPGSNSSEGSGYSANGDETEAKINCMLALYHAIAAAQVSCAPCDGDGCELGLAGTPPNPLDPLNANNIEFTCMEDDIIPILWQIVMPYEPPVACFCHRKENAPTFTFDVQCSACAPAEKCEGMKN